MAPQGYFGGRCHADVCPPDHCGEWLPQSAGSDRFPHNTTPHPAPNMTKPNATLAGQALKLALAASAVGQFLAAPAVLAQQGSTDQDATELAPMLVTGSMIPTTDIVGLTPVDVFSQVDPEARRRQRTTDVVRRLPAAVGAGNFNESRGNGGDGSARIALRGIPGGTLVLINGRRVAPGAFADSDVSLNMIPLAAIEAHQDQGRRLGGVRIGRHRRRGERHPPEGVRGRRTVRLLRQHHRA